MVVSPGENAFVNVISSAAPVLTTIVLPSIASGSTPLIGYGTPVDSARLPPASGNSLPRHPANFST
eukprot:11445182-Heterocapsa_arctica.AAC.1